MKRMMKKTMAVALALAIVAGGVPVLTGGFDLLKPGITANAAETKTIANGVTYAIGDTMRFETEVNIICDESVASPDGVPEGEYLLSSPVYVSEYDQFLFEIFPDMPLWISSNGRSFDPDDVAGIRVISGDGTFEKPYEVSIVYKDAVSLKNVDVALDDSITLRFYATQVSVDYENVDSVTLTGPNGPIKVAVTDFKSDYTDRYYVFSYPLYATQLDEDVTIQFKKGNDIVKIGDDNSFSYKVNDYCDYVIADEKNEFNDRTEKAAKSLKNLGIACVNYFDNTSTEIPFMDDDYSELTDFTPNFDSEDGKISLVLDSKLSARLYIDGLEAGTKTADNAYTAIEGNGGKACFELSKIAPTDLDTSSCIMYGAGYTFSAMSYCARAINSTNLRAVDVAKAVYEYYKYIEDYANRPVVTLLYLRRYHYESQSFETQYGPEYTIKYDYTPGMTWADLVEKEGGHAYNSNDDFDPDIHPEIFDEYGFLCVNGLNIIDGEVYLYCDDSSATWVIYEGEEEGDCFKVSADDEIDAGTVYAYESMFMDE